MKISRRARPSDGLFLFLTRDHEAPERPPRAAVAVPAVSILAVAGGAGRRRVPHARRSHHECAQRSHKPPRFPAIAYTCSPLLTLLTSHSFARLSQWPTTSRRRLPGHTMRTGRERSARPTSTANRPRTPRCPTSRGSRSSTRRARLLPTRRCACVCVCDLQPREENTRVQSRSIDMHTLTGSRAREKGEVLCVCICVCGRIHREEG